MPTNSQAINKKKKIACVCSHTISTVMKPNGTWMIFNIKIFVLLLFHSAVLIKHKPK